MVKGKLMPMHLQSLREIEMHLVIEMQMATVSVMQR